MQTSGTKRRSCCHRQRGARAYIRWQNPLSTYDSHAGKDSCFKKVSPGHVTRVVRLCRRGVHLDFSTSNAIRSASGSFSDQTSVLSDSGPTCESEIAHGHVCTMHNQHNHTLRLHFRHPCHACAIKSCRKDGALQGFSCPGYP
jgi:hypothetical protein